MDAIVFWALQNEELMGNCLFCTTWKQPMDATARFFMALLHWMPGAWRHLFAWQKVTGLCLLYLTATTRMQSRPSCRPPVWLAGGQLTMIGLAVSKTSVDLITTVPFVCIYMFRSGGGARHSFLERLLQAQVGWLTSCNAWLTNQPRAACGSAGDVQRLKPKKKKKRQCSPNTTLCQKGCWNINCIIHSRPSLAVRPQIIISEWAGWVNKGGGGGTHCMTKLQTSKLQQGKHGMSTHAITGQQSGLLFGGGQDQYWQTTGRGNRKWYAPPPR